jgi:hypothetical protein
MSSAQVDGQSCGQAEWPILRPVLIGVASFMVFLYARRKAPTTHLAMIAASRFRIDRRR